MLHAVIVAHPNPKSLSREIADAYEKCDYSRAMRLIMAAADRANAYIESCRPW